MFVTEEVRCSHFGTCGGCRLQNLPYDAQLEGKEEIVRECFGEALPIVPCASPWEYRNKMEFSFSQDRAGAHYLGLMMRGKRGRVVSLDECHLTAPWFAELLGNVRAWWEGTDLLAYHPPTDSGHLRTLTVREGKRTGERMVILTVSGNPDFPVGDLDEFAQVVGEVDSLILRHQIIAKKVPTRFEQEVLAGKPFITETLYRDETPLTFKIRPSSFFQPNTDQAEVLYTRALELAELEEEPLLLDLYCGTGAIGMFAAPHAREVLGIELNPDGVADANANIHLNSIPNMRVEGGDVADTLETSLAPSTIIVDPPRAGLGAPVIKKILALAPKKILYISCNPKSQARDVHALAEGGYSIQAVQPVDQFPHTPHIENIVVLAR